MTDTKHTPGPWKVTASRSGIMFNGSAGIDCHEWSGTTCSLADLNLIASAPDLLAALRNLTEWACEHTSPLDANSPHKLLITARAAIAKAEKS